MMCVFYCLLGAFVVYRVIFSVDASCGRAIKGRVAIHRGSPVDDQRRWPWMVSIQWKINSVHFCGGTLIDAQWVVTAAHCVKDIENKTNEVKLVLGSLDLSTEETSRITTNLARVFIHPDYEYRKEPFHVGNDIALLRVSHEVSFSSYVQPACLPEANPSYYRDCHVIGWGRKNDGEHPGGRLQDLFVRTFAPPRCAMALPSMSPMIREGNFICAMGFMAGRICKGDSGGPLMCRTGQDPDWSVVGVASWTTDGCSYSERPFGFTDVAHYVDWIKQTRVSVAHCGNPGVPLYGFKEGCEYFFPHKVTFFCHPGYKLRGASSITCQENGKWSAPVPTCLEAKCKNLTSDDAPTNGGLVCHWNDEKAAQFCSVRCNKGYEFPNRVKDFEYCSPRTDFTWSHQRVNKHAVIPACISEYFSGYRYFGDMFYFDSSCQTVSPQEQQRVYENFRNVLISRRICANQANKNCETKDMAIVCGRTEAPRK